MKRKIISLITALATAAMANIPLPVMAAEAAEPEAVLAGTYGELECEVNDDGTVTITDCDASVTSVDIPAEIDGMPVTAIGDEAFQNCYSLTDISIPDSITSIGYRAFQYCKSLTAISLPDGVTSISSGAFNGCVSLTDISIPDGVTSISDDAFGFCYSLTDISIPDSVTSIGDWAFADCYRMTDISIPDSVTSIGDCAFYYCEGLTDINLPDSVTSIGDDAFAYCASLTDISIPDSVTSISDSTFAYCYSLTDISIPDSVESIGDSAFAWCDSLADVYYSGTEEKWKAIDIGAENYNLLNASIHFTGAESTPEPDDPLEVLEYEVTDNGTVTITGCDTSVTSVDIPAEIGGKPVTAIGDSAFWYCTSLTDISIPDSVESIGYGAFRYCTSLTDVYYGGTEEEWNAIDIGLYNTDLTNATIHFTAPDVGIQTAILHYSAAENGTVVNSVAVNNLPETVKCTVYTAVYDGTGALKGAGMVDADIAAESDTGVDITVPCTIEAGDVIKTFLWQDMTPLCMTDEVAAA